MIVGLLKSLYAFIKKTLVWWLIAIGLFLLYISYFGNLGVSLGVSPAFEGFIASIGTAILAGGIFQAITKSFQFIGIFKDEIHNVVYGTEHLEKRNDLREIWQRVLGALLKKKFPDIKDRIERTIYEKYFPMEEVYYYREYTLEMTIQLLDDQTDFVQVIENAYFDIKPDSPLTEINLKYESTYDKDQFETRTKTNLETIKVNGVEKKKESNFVTEPNYESGKKFKSNWELKLNGSELYSIISGYKKIYSVSLNTSNTIRFRRFVNNLVIKIKFPKSLDVKLTPMGLIDKFMDVPQGIGDWDIWKRFEGVVFPLQGCLIAIKKIQ